MDVRHLDLLRELAERGTITAVAAATHRTPSAVSQQLRTAQRELGATLVEPAGRGLRLTAAGRLLAAGAADVATAVARVQAEWDAFRDDVGGVVTVASPPSTAAFLLPRCVRPLAEQSVELRWTDVDVAEEDYAGLTRDYDLVIGHSLLSRTRRRPPGLRTRALVREPLDIAIPAGHPLAARATVSPDDVVDEDWIGVPPGFPFDVVLQSIEAATGRQLTVIQRLTDNAVVEALVAAGLGLAVLPRFTTRPHPDVALRPLAGVPTGRHVVAFSRPDRAERLSVRTVVDTLAEVSAEVARETAERLPAPAGGRDSPNLAP